MARSSFNQKKLFPISTIAGLSLLIVAVLLLSITHPASARSNADTYVSGNITTNTTWTLAGSPYILTGDVGVVSGVTLSIEAGVVVKSNGMNGLVVSGVLDVNGDSGNPVIFTSYRDDTAGGDSNGDGSASAPAAGDWKGIYVPDGGTASLDYAELRYGGGLFWQDGVTARHWANLRKDGSGTLTFNHVISTQSGACGIRLESTSGVHTISNSTFSNNQEYGVCLTGSTANTITFSGSTFANNVLQSIATPPHSSGFSIDASNVLDKPIYVTSANAVDVNTTWSPQVYLLEDVGVAVGSTLTIPGGAVVKFNGMTGLVVSGVLDVNGDSGNPVIFTSYRDDTAGGDSNGDGSGSAPAAGDWRGIYVPNGGTASLDYAELRYGGGLFWQDGVTARHWANLRKDGSGTLTFNHVISTQSGACGLRLESTSGVHTISNSTFSNNQAYGVCLTGSTANTITFSGSTFANNVLQSIATPPHSSGFSIDASNVLDKPIYVTSANAVDVNTTWSPQIYLLEDVGVAAGFTLTIPGGAVVKFNGMTGLVVSGVLDVNGDSGNPVIFTSYRDDTAGGDSNGDGSASAPAAGDWRGIYVPNGGTASLDYTELRYGGGLFWQDGVTARHWANLRKDGSGTLTFNHVISTQSGACGLRLESTSGVHTISNSTFSNNQEYGVCLTGSTANTITFSGSTFANNVLQSIATPPHSSGFSIDASNVLDKPIYVTSANAVDVNTTWSPQVYLLEDVGVAAGSTLSIPGGAVVKFNGMTGLVVSGILDVNGGSGNPVIFTSNKDDTAGGDSNGDGSASAPAAGDWKGIYVPDGGTASLDYTELRYGGGEFWLDAVTARHWGNLRKDGSGTLTLNYSVVSRSGACGLRFENTSGSHSITYTSFQNNLGYGACINGNSSNTINFFRSEFVGNLPQSIITSAHSSGFSIDYTNVLDKPIYVTSGDVDVDSTWSPQVYLLDDISVHAGKTLTLPALVTARFNGMTSIVVFGNLVTTGTGTYPVTFTNSTDLPGGGNWKGIYIADGGNAQLHHTDIRYGGGEFWLDGVTARHWANLRKDGSGSLIAEALTSSLSGCEGLKLYGTGSTVQIMDSSFVDNLGWGIYASPSAASLDFDKVLIHHNGAGGMYVYNPGGTNHIYASTIVANTGPGVTIADGTLAILGGSDVNGNNIYGNSSHQVQNLNAITLDASHNWWGINPPTPSIYGSVDITFPLSGPAANAPAYLADAAISETSLPSTGLNGQPLDYAFNVTNNGPHEAYYLKVSAVLPDGVSLTNFSGTDWMCTQDGQQLSCVLGTVLAPSGVSGLTVTLTAAVPVHMLFDFTLGAANNDAVPANNMLAVDTQVNTQVFIPMVKR